MAYADIFADITADTAFYDQRMTLAGCQALYRTLARATWRNAEGALWSAPDAEIAERVAFVGAEAADLRGAEGVLDAATVADLARLGWTRVERAPRADGFYWVRVPGAEGDPVVAWWKVGCWLFCGSDEPLRDDQVLVLSGPLAP